MSTKSVDFRPLPTPEQVRAHGEGGLWEGEGGTWYKLWDMPRNGSWWDSEFRKLTREIVEANPGQLWERNTSTDRDYKRIYKLAYREGVLESDFVSKNLPWDARLTSMPDVSVDQSWRPLHPSSTPKFHNYGPWNTEAWKRIDHIRRCDPLPVIEGYAAIRTTGQHPTI